MITGERTTCYIDVWLKQGKNKGKRRKSADILVTLAWQDILVEKRWQDISEKLYAIKDQVLENVDSEVINYISSSLIMILRNFLQLLTIQKTWLFTSR